MMLKEPTIADIKKTAERIKPYVHETPVFRSATMDRICGAELFFKAENFQKVGAFKARGAVNALFCLGREEAKKGVATHSSGNHAAALAYAAACRGVPAYVVMPDDAPEVKKAAVAGYGAEIIFSSPGQEARESALGRLLEETGATFIHPYDNYRVIAGQATAALELVNRVADLDTVIAPVGGGGLLSGTALTVSSLRPQAAIYGAEPKGADDARRSLRAGRIIFVKDPQTIADGLRTSLGDRTFPIIKRLVDDIITVDDTEIVEAMRLVWERMKIVVEPSAVLPLALLLASREQVKGRKIGLIFSGGNVDLQNLPWQSTVQS